MDKPYTELLDFKIISNNTSNRTSLVAFGNPLLDMCCTLENDEILLKYNLEKDSQCEKHPDVIKNIIGDLQKLNNPISETPGGSALNMLRILKSLITTSDNDVIFCGAVGTDKYGLILKDLLKQCEVQTELQSLSNYSTGTCVCLIRNENRSLVANIGAARYYSKDHIIDSRINILLMKSEMMYVEGYFVDNKYSLCDYLLYDISHKNEIVFVFNISAAYICNEHLDQFKTLAENADIVFGNCIEFMTLGKVYGSDNLFDISKYLFKNYIFSKKKLKIFSEKLLVVTDGPKSVNIFRCSNEEITREVYLVPLVPLEEIVDTTGAGDAFSAGFLHGFFKGYSPLDCAKYGSTIAARVIKRIGCNI